MKFSLPIAGYKQFEENRRKCLKLSDQLRIASKSAIGFLLKGLSEKAHQSLKEAGKVNTMLQNLLKKNPYLNSVGGAHIGTEEYVEAVLLEDYMAGKPLRSQKVLGVTHEAYISGLCDTTGEMVRLARMHPERMQQILKDITQLYQSTLEIVVTRNKGVRNKLEDLQRNMKKMEEMVFRYELQHS